MRLTNLSNMSKQSEERAQDFQKCVAERKKTHIFLKMSLPFNSCQESVGPSLPSGWSRKWSWMPVLRDLWKMTMEIPILVKLTALYIPDNSQHPSPFSSPFWGCQLGSVCARSFPSNYTCAIPHILILRHRRTPWKSQKWLPLFCPTSVKYRKTPWGSFWSGISETHLRAWRERGLSVIHINKLYCFRDQYIYPS